MYVHIDSAGISVTRLVVPQSPMVDTELQVKKLQLKGIKNKAFINF